ncbi:hypothetical protein DPMN_168526 [Dreissena polymorpha]|uniref:Uncharacterized protein n=1 Tax=Dreissena polymorpha TaxID=45954 RepID=A0A9D4F246_DREPO|nr:hypothetical protein DPMN_168526 [Dreissena polymorpha]
MTRSNILKDIFASYDNQFTIRARRADNDVNSPDHQEVHQRSYPMLAATLPIQNSQAVRENLYPGNITIQFGDLPIHYREHTSK